ncbi:MAG: hydroxymethylbilane synthase [Pseudomonadota bacterium]
MKIGTRSSLMAITQTEHVAALLMEADPSIEPEIIRRKPRGDLDQVSRLDRHGGKGGAFVEAIRDAMRAGELDCAMHSLKDMPGNEETPGLVIAAMLKRDAIGDALVLHPDHDIDSFLETKAAGLKIGTNAVRRAAYLKRLFPDAEIIHYRGAADTRIDKLDGRAMQKLPDGGEVGPADAIIAAEIGLHRIGRADRIVHTFSPDEMLPAIGQGIVAVEAPETGWRARAALALIDHPATRICADAEREVLWVLNGHCNSPIAGHAHIEGETMHLKAAVMSLDGSEIIEEEAEGPADEPRALGRQVALALRDRGGDRLIEETRV